MLCFVLQQQQLRARCKCSQCVVTGVCHSAVERVVVVSFLQDLSGCIPAIYLEFAPFQLTAVE